MIKKILTIGIIILFLGTFITPSVAIDNIKNQYNPISFDNTLYVGGSGEGNYTIIQDAIDNASDGDTIFVYDDSSPYKEIIHVHRSINLIGENKSSTIIDGGKNGNVVYVKADKVNISGFTIKNSGSENYDAGIYIRSSFCTISGNIISDNNGNGILIYNSDSNSIKDNIISPDNDYFIRGLYLMHSHRNTIVNNSIINNKKFSIHSLAGSNKTLSNNDWGIKLSESDYNTILGNTISNNDWGIELSKSHYNTILGNTISNNDWGIKLSESHYNTILGNTISNNDWGIDLWKSDYNTILGNTISNNDWGIELGFSKNNTINNNNLSYNKLASLYLYVSDKNTLDSNVISKNKNGLLLNLSDNNRIICNIIELNYESGISIEGCRYNKISGNTINSNKGNAIFIGCYIFIYALCSKFNLIKSNNITNNCFGILLSGFTYAKNRFNFIIKNNFIDNNQDAYFTNSTINCWKQNYWNKSRYLPKIILGDMYIKDRYYNWLNFDWRPAKEPYDIEV